MESPSNLKELFRTGRGAGDYVLYESSKGGYILLVGDSDPCGYDELRVTAARVVRWSFLPAGNDKDNQMDAFIRSYFPEDLVTTIMLENL